MLHQTEDVENEVINSVFGLIKHLPGARIRG